MWSEAARDRAWLAARRLSAALTLSAAAALTLSAAAALTLSACGGGGGRPDLLVSAASSLKTAFTGYGQRFSPARSRFSFAGSDQLATQIEQGIRPDLFASANVSLPQDLFARGLVQRPTVFAANRLVIAVPAGSTRIWSLGDLARPGTRLAIGSPTVPVGSYTRKVLAGLGAGARPILANVRSTEPDVSGIVGKLVEGAVDAGFLYITDVRATHGKLRSVELPGWLRPRVAYAIAVVTGAPHPREASQFIAGLLSGPGQRSLRQAGFEPRPGR
jgi:molybdate transport system substrate-binding protein